MRHLREEIFTDALQILQGSVDSHIILTGSSESAVKETECVIEKLNPGCGYICASDRHFPAFPRKN